MEKLVELAKEIQKSFKSFYLAGGTAIMIKYNHRVSVDLDFMTSEPFTPNSILHKIKKKFHIQTYEIYKDNFDVIISSVRISFIFFPFENVEKLQKQHGIVMASDYDLFLNKIYATNRRIDWKDLFDAAFLFRLHSWNKNKIKQDFEKKIPSQSFELYLGALLNFDNYPELPEWDRESLSFI